MKKTHVKKNQVIIREGDEGGSAYVIESGTVEVSRIRANGQKRTLAVLSEKAFFGELSLVDNLPRSATVTALEDCVISEIPREVFDALSKSNPKALMPFLRIIADRLRNTLKIIEEYKYQPTSPRK